MRQDRPKAQDGPRRAILVVDDDPDSLNIYSLGLIELGYTVYVADDAGAGLRIACAAVPDLCVVGDSPAISGIELRRGLAASETTVAVPCVCLTNDMDREWELTGAGFRRVLLKPCTATELERIIRHVLSEALQSPGSPA